MFALRPASAPNRALQEQNGIKVLEDLQRFGATRQDGRGKMLRGEAG